MKIEFNLPDLLGALETVSIVSPRPVTASCAAGYLFVVKDKQCFLYSRDDLCVARASFPLTSSDGEGQFVYPAEYIGALRYLGEESCTLEATSVEERFTVKYESASGAESERSSFDPQLLSTCDEDLEATGVTYEFQAGILREAINQARPFLGKLTDSKVPENFKGLQVIDATRVDKDKGIDYSKGDGYLYASDGTTSFYFLCDAFKGKGLEIHGQHLGSFLSFLGKCGQKVTIRKGDHFTFALSEDGRVFGWPRHARLHDKFAYYTLKTDKMSFRINRARMLNALQYVRNELGPSNNNRNKIKINFDPERRQFWFTISEGTAKAKSIPVQVEIKAEEGLEPKAFTIGGNIDFLLELFNVKGHDIEFRGAIFPPDANRKSDVGLFRTIDDFYLDQSGKVTPEPEGAVKCRVTRFMPSKD